MTEMKREREEEGREEGKNGKVVGRGKLNAGNVFAMASCMMHKNVIFCIFSYT